MTETLEGMVTVTKEVKSKLLSPISTIPALNDTLVKPEHPTNAKIPICHYDKC